VKIFELIKEQNWESRIGKDGTIYLDPMDEGGHIQWSSLFYRAVSNSQFSALSNILGQEISYNVGPFFHQNNGIILHFGLLSVFGVVENISRNPLTEQSQPFSIGNMNEEFQISSPTLYDRGMRVVGGISVVRRDRIIAEPNSAYWVNFGDTRSRDFDTIDDLLVTAEKIILNYYLGENQFSASYEEIDLHLRSAMNALN
jgi:hypothetical protein